MAKFRDKHWLVTGGAGFIGSHFVERALRLGWCERLTVLDSLTYAGRRANLAFAKAAGAVRLVVGSVCCPRTVRRLLDESVAGVFHFAAESHVDRSIECAGRFVDTNIVGTQVLVDAVRESGGPRMVHVSTDEVYGSLEFGQPAFTEDSPLKPSSPYAATKAASDLLVLAAHKTHGIDAVITRSGNNFGIRQSSEKLIPKTICRLVQGRPALVCGDESHARDWVDVAAHVDGIRLAYMHGQAGRVYNLGGDCERPNGAVIGLIMNAMGVGADRVERVAARPGHDARYALDVRRAKEELGFRPGAALESKVASLVAWYGEHPERWRDASHRLEVGLASPQSARPRRAAIR